MGSDGKVGFGGDSHPQGVVVFQFAKRQLPPLALMLLFKGRDGGKDKGPRQRAKMKPRNGKEHISLYLHLLLSDCLPLLSPYYSFSLAPVYATIQADLFFYLSSA